MSLLHGPGGSLCVPGLWCFPMTLQMGAAQGLSDVHAPGCDLAEGGRGACGGDQREPAWLL